MFQQMSFGSRASVGAAVYENTAVLEDGRWKLHDDHTFNTLSANYKGRGLPERFHAIYKVAASFQTMPTPRSQLMNDMTVL
jgi:hypothetical protein